MSTISRSMQLMFAALGLASSLGLHAAVTDAMIDNDATTTNDVVSNGMGPQAQRFSPLTQINAQTVKSLVPAWSMSFGGEKQRGAVRKSREFLHAGRPARRAQP